MLTLKEIAKASGTSVSTVSHVLNSRQDTYIGAATRERVLKTVQELGYRPNQLARGLRMHRSMTIGVMAADLAFETHVRKFTAILNAAANGNFATVVALAGEHKGMARSGLERFLAVRVEGIVVASFTLSLESDVLSESRKLGVPLVAIDPLERDIAAVRIDREEAGRLAARHLLDAGRRRLLFVGGDSAQYPTDAARHRGFRRAHYERELQCADDSIIPWGPGYLDRVVGRVANRGSIGPVDGLVCLSDEIAIELIHYLVARGIQIPTDVSVVGYNNISLSRFVGPPLTTIAQPDAEAGEAAVRLLIALIEHRRENRKTVEAFEDVILKPRLVVRASCGVNPQRIGALDTKNDLGEE